jgi:O-antigen/teichoic acid export membrane protein
VTGEVPTPRAIRARHLVRAAGGSAAATLWLAFLGLLTTPYMLHELGRASYGVFALITIVAGYLSNLEFGFGHALVRFAARARATGDPVEERRVLETSLLVFLAAGVVGGTIAFVLAPTVVDGLGNVPGELHDSALTALRVGAVILVLVFLSSFCSSALTGLGRFSIVNAMRVINGTAISVSAVVTVAFGGGIDAVLVVQLAVGLVSFGVLAGVVLVAERRVVLPRVHVPTFQTMLRYSSLVFLGGLAYQVMLQGPVTVLAGHVDTAQLAAYSVPAIVMQQLSLLASAASLGFLPLASAESVGADRRRLADIFRSHMRLTLLVMGPLAAYLVIFGHQLLATWIDAGFAADADGPLQFLSVAALALALGGPAADVARGLGRPAWPLVYVVAAATVEIALALLLVGAHGVSGVAAGVCIGVCAATAPLVIVVSRYLLGIGVRDLVGDLAPVALVVVVAIGLFALGSGLGGAFAGAVLTGLLATAALASLAYRYVLDERERQAFRRG